MNALALQLYTCLMWLAQPLLRRKLARRARVEPGYLEAVPERFGDYTQPAEPSPELVWMHAVSLGETRTAAILLQALRAQWPGLRVLLTHGTATGRAEGRGLLRQGDVQVWQAWDSRAAVARFLTHFKPRLGILLETEVWPQAIAAAQARQIPVVLVNARLSDKSLAQATRLALLSRPAFRALTAVYAQTEGDAARLRQLGAPVTAVFGNLKYDAAPDAAQLAQGRQWRRSLARPVVMLASARDGEEADFLKQIVALAQSKRELIAIESIANENSKDARMVFGFQPLIVPRHPQRFDEVQRLIEKSGLTVSRRSSWKDAERGPAQQAAAASADVWLGDSLGDMALYYALSDLALLGGSFAPLGGQNLIEPAASGCPVVMGPHTFNFADAAERAEAEGAAFRVADMAAAVRLAQALLQAPGQLKSAAAAGVSFAARHRGATARTVAALTPLLGP